MSDLKKEVGRRISEIRKQSGDSQASCAEKLGIKRATLAAYEAGTNAMPDEVKRLFTQHYGVTYEYLISGVHYLEEPKTEYIRHDLVALLDQMENNPLHREVKRRVLQLIEENSQQKDKIIKLLEDKQ